MIEVKVTGTTADEVYVSMKTIVEKLSSTGAVIVADGEGAIPSPNAATKKPKKPKKPTKPKPSKPKYEKGDEAPDETTPPPIPVEEIREFAKQAMSVVGRAVMIEIISEFGAGKISDIKPEDYPKFMVAVEEAKKAVTR